MPIYRPLSFLLAPALAAALLLGGCATTDPGVRVEAPLAATASVSSLPLDATIPLDSRLREGRLENGLRYVIREAPRPPARAQLWLVVDAGSVLETEEQQGLAHFLEHMAFNGTERFEKQEMVEYLESIGMRFGPDLNAYTNSDETVYMLQVPTDDEQILERGFEILDQWAGAIALEPEEVDKERGVVIEEWRLSRGAGSRLLDRQLPVLLGGSRYAERLPIGQKEVLETAPAEELRSFYRTWYRPEHMAIVAVGDFDAKTIEGKVRAHFGDLAGEGPLPERPDTSPAPHAETRVSIEDDPEETTVTVGVYEKVAPPPEGRVGDYRDGLVDSLFFAMLNERMGEVARQPDAPYVFAGASTSRFVRDVALHSVGASVPEDRIEEGFAAAVAELERVQQHGFTASELDRAKTNLLRTYQQAAKEVDREDSRSIARELTRHVLVGEPVPGIEAELELVERFLPEIALAEVDARAAGWMGEENRVILLTAPEGREIDLPTDEQLLAVLERVDEADLEPWTDATPDAPLVAEVPSGGEIVTERENATIGTTEWELDNGVRVILKPTDFRTDQILVAGWSPGGTSLVETEDLPSAILATAIADESGLGAFDRFELEKVLAGTQAGVGVGLGQLEESVRGSTSAEDLDTFFRLLWLRFHEPRFDAESWERLRTRFETMIAHRDRDPGYVFQEKLQNVLTRESPRRPVLDEELLAAADVAVAERVYRDRFADASDFTFAFVGSFDPEDLRPRVETWLGSLPTTSREETWRDEGVERPDGEIRFEVRKGLEPKAQVRWILHGPAEWSREEQHLIGSMTDALAIELRQVLREDLSGTYGVGVSGGISSRPREEYSVTISFGCDPERVDELLARLRVELERVRQEGFDSATLEKVRESQRRGRETEVTENGPWLGWIQTYWTLDLDPALILAHDELVEGLTLERLQEAANRYLDEDRSVLGLLLPESGPTDSGG